MRGAGDYRQERARSKSTGARLRCLESRGRGRAGEDTVAGGCASPGGNRAMDSARDRAGGAALASAAGVEGVALPLLAPKPRADHHDEEGVSPPPPLPPGVPGGAAPPPLTITGRWSASGDGS